MVAGYLREKDGYYHIVLSYIDEYGKRKTPSRSTKMPVKGNKKRAEQMLIQVRQEMEQELEYRKQVIKSGMSVLPDKLTFTQFLADWLKMMRASVEATTFAGYSQTVNNKIIPYFDKRFPKLMLRDVTPKHIQDYYTYKMTENGVSANTVIHRYANIRKALQYAFKTGLIDSNPADKVQRPKKQPHPCEPYNTAELEQYSRL